MTIAIIGASGFIGNRIFQSLVQKNSNDLIGTFYKHKEDPNFVFLDITSRSSVEKFLSKNRPDLVFWIAGSKNLKKCEKNCEKESQVFAIAYKQYLAFLFKTKKCDDKEKKVSKAVEDKREHKCLLKFEKETLEPATHKFQKCYQDKVDTCMYKTFEKKSKKTLKRTLKKKTKKTLRKK